MLFSKTSGVAIERALDAGHGVGDAAVGGDRVEPQLVGADRRDVGDAHAAERAGQPPLSAITLLTSENSQPVISRPPPPVLGDQRPSGASSASTAEHDGDGQAAASHAGEWVMPSGVTSGAVVDGQDRHRGRARLHGGTVGEIDTVRPSIVIAPV